MSTGAALPERAAATACGVASPAPAFMLDRINGLAGPGATLWPTRTRCSPSAITLSPAERPLMTAANGWGGLPELDAPLLGLVVGTDCENVIALLVGQHRRARIATTSTGWTPSSTTVTNSPSVNS